MNGGNGTNPMKKIFIDLCKSFYILTFFVGQNHFGVFGRSL